MGNEMVAQEKSYGVVNFEEYAMSVDSVIHQIALIQEVQKKVMRQGEHFGTIPGCGDKPTLLKPGAEKLGFTFRLAPEFDVSIVDWSGGHREYQIKCRLRHIPTGTMVGEGVGTCTTMEGKFRFRWDNTGNEVPKEYWDTKNKDLLGGPFNTVRKVDGKWYIFQRVEHDNPADYYNTCEKMGKKRAHVDAILTATAASDIFTQDIEDMPEVINQQTKTETAKNPPKQPQSKSSQQASVKQDAGDNKTAREKLDDELKAYCADNEGLIDMNLYKTVLQEVSKWTDKDGKEHSFDEITEKISDKWVGSALGKLRDRMKVDNA